MKRIKDLLAGLSDRHRKDLGKKLMAMAATLAMLGGMAGASTMALADDADAAAAEQVATASAKCVERCIRGCSGSGIRPV